MTPLTRTIAAAQATSIIEGLKSEDRTVAFLLPSQTLANGLGMTKDLKLLEQETHALAEEGGPLGRCILANFRYGGGFGAKGFAASIGNFEVAGKAGVTPACTYLSYLTSEGLGMTKSAARALGYWRKTADGGEMDTQRQAGVARCHGGVPRVQLQDMTNLASKKPIPLTGENVAFMVGLATARLRECGHPEDGEKARDFRSFPCREPSARW